ncbi:hypothetical protein ATE84_3528 [Aquimarina sp. MAR_2010_214]|uniref:hypothetical protein n=1 Tax=Aquimarina sp. MAR_2010_214 TaxID=1250026 RepID=UPI000C71488D|nr:hypothetical protein [Aquimarina sp. MAR_2010_214]PKV51443.1 hypothetical protein ATE84_3528 [Aquimarina sp. MAR_2010_214]
MKIKYFKYAFYIFLSGIITLTSCSKDDEPATPESEQPASDINEGNGISKDDLKISKGDIGVIIDARNVAKKGILPAIAEVKIDAKEGNYSKTLDLNEFTNMASISFPIEELSKAAIAELREGVSATVDIKDKDGKSIVSETFTKFSLKENGVRLTIKADQVVSVVPRPSFNPNIPYYLQVVLNGQPTNRVLEAETSPNKANRFVIRKNNFDPKKESTKFYIVPVPGYGTYYIKTKDNYFLGVFPSENSSITTHTIRAVKIDNPDTYLALKYRFSIRTAENGEVYLESHLNKTIDYLFYDQDENIETWQLYSGTSNGSLLYPLHFRIMPATIQWKIETISTEYMKPIFPAADSSFGFNSTLSNCSPGTLEQEVGTEISSEKTATIGWEESLELTSESTYEVSASVEVSASAKFFGVGVDVTASASTSYSVTKGMTTTNTGFGEQSTVESQSFFSSRTIEVLPQTAVLVYDAYQTYSNITIPFVQRYRVRGTDTTNNKVLTGNQIVSQFGFNDFDGVITLVGSDFVELTVRGTTKIDNLIETQSEVKEVTTTCD